VIGSLFLQHDLSAFGRQRRHGQWRFGRFGARMKHFLGKPPVERLVAAVARRKRILRLTAGVSRRTFDADVEVIVVAPVGAHLVHPGLAPGGLAQGLLDCGVDEDALDFGLLGGGLDDRRLSGRPMRPVDLEAVLGHHVDRRHVLALLERERAARHRVNQTSASRPT